MMKNKTGSWIIFDIFIISVILTLIFWGILDDDNSFTGAAFFIVVGLFFLTSNVIRDNSFFAKSLSWVAENIFKPKTKFNHVIWGLFLIFIGILTLYLQPISPVEKELFNSLEKSPSFWILIVLVLIFNILVGVYTARRGRKKVTIDDPPKKDNGLVS